MAISENIPSHNGVIRKSQLSVPLAPPWHFRRQGVYQLRVRPRGSHASCTVSLRTTDRPTAMKTSKLLQTTLRVFHLDNPEASWDELRERLKVIAEDVLATPTEWERLDDEALRYGDWQSDLHAITRTEALTAAQTKAAMLGGRILGAAQERLHGRPQALVEIIDELNQPEHPDRRPAVSASLSVSDPKPLPPVTFASLAQSYRKEHEANVKPSSFKEITYCHGTLSDALGDLDMRIHTRADLIVLPLTEN